MSFVTFLTPQSIYNGSSTASPMLYRRNGSISSASVVSGPNTTVTFTSGVSLSAGYTGFVGSAAYFCAPGGAYVVSASGQSVASGMGMNYLNSQSCVWILSAPANQRVLVNFTAFTTETCCDFLVIYNGAGLGGTIAGTYSGARGPFQVASTTSTLTLRFLTDNSNTNSGFAANVIFFGKNRSYFPSAE
jgi:hypothetical protein